MATGKEGDTRGWSDRDGGTGYKLERHNGKLIWVQYFQGRPTGIWKGKGFPGIGNVDLTGHLSNVARFFYRHGTLPGKLQGTLKNLNNLKITTVPLHENFSDSSEEIGLLGAGGKTNTSNTSNKRKLMFGVPIKQWQTATKNERQLYKRLSNNKVNSPAITLNKVSNINPSIKDIKAGNVRNAWFTNISDEDWDAQLEILKQNHQEWLRKKGRIK